MTTSLSADRVARRPGFRSRAIDLLTISKLCRLALLLTGLVLAGFAVSGFAKETRVLPGADPFDEALLATFAKERKARGPDYRPRTRHFDENGDAIYSNRLLLESSPYLLQHAHNPIN